MKNLVLCIILVSMIFIVTGCVETEYVEEPYYPIEPEPTNHSLEMQNLINFLNEDKTNEQTYNDDTNRGMDYYVCCGYVRDLAINANDYGIRMGGISLRDTMSVGAGTRYYHAMSYCIVDDKFIVIESQSDKIFTLETLKEHHGDVYKYITIFPNAQMMTNFGKHKETINIYLQGKFNESEIIDKFPPN